MTKISKAKQTLFFPLFIIALLISSACAGTKPLQVTSFTSNAEGFHATSTIISGESQAILIDSQFTLSAARKLLAEIKKTGKDLTKVYITHAHPDHFFGYEVIQEAYPDAAFLAAPEVILELKKISPGKHQYWKPIYGDDLASTYQVPSPYNSNKILLDGHSIDLIKMSAGESEHSVVVSVPSANALITGDLVFHGVHPWLAEADKTRRENWKANLLKIENLNVTTLIAGHKSIPASNSPEAISFMLRYLEDFEQAASESENAEQAIERMKNAYPKLQLPVILEIAMKTEFERTSKP